MSLLRWFALAILLAIALERLAPRELETVAIPAAPTTPESATPEPEPEAFQGPQDRLGFFPVPETKAFSHGSAAVQEIERRLPAVHPYWNECPVTWVHEGTHYINSSLTKDSSVSQGLYLLDVGGLVLDCPRLTLAQIAAAIPEGERRTIYATYLVTQRQWWDESPLYLLNEWVAYGNGTACRKSLNWTGKQRIDTVRFFLEMEIYIQHMVRLAAQDPDYKGLHKLETFVAWYGQRVREIVGPDDIALAELELRTK